LNKTEISKGRDNADTATPARLNAFPGYRSQSRGNPDPSRGVAEKTRHYEPKSAELRPNCCANAALIAVLHGFADKRCR